MPAPYFLSALILAAIVGMATGSEAVVLPVFLVLWAIPHAFRLAIWIRLRRIDG